MVKKRQKAGVIQQSRSNLTSRIKSKLFRKKQFSSALYQIGRDEKSIFWYWEIDHELGHYREFRTTNLAEGRKRFQEEDFTSWPKFEDGWVPV